MSNAQKKDFQFSSLSVNHGITSHSLVTHNANMQTVGIAGAPVYGKILDLTENYLDTSEGSNVNVDVGSASVVAVSWDVNETRPRIILSDGVANGHRLRIICKSSSGTNHLLIQYVRGDLYVDAGSFADLIWFNGEWYANSSWYDDD